MSLPAESPAAGPREIDPRYRRPYPRPNEQTSRPSMVGSGGRIGPTVKYRAEIDGLRAVAVVPVILYHAGVPGVSGGFVGVDVFFVISGFLITGLILQAQDAGRFSLLTFYERRARRILPALFLVLAVTVVAGYSLIVPWEFPDFLRSLAATALFLSNVHFWENVGYFALAAEEQPLLHTWSLAVEEQFYVLFPLLLLIPMRRAALTVVIGALFVASLALSQWGSVHEPEVNFFFTPSRVWELMAGALCAIWQRARAPRPIGAAALAGLAMILASVLFYDASIPFPSLYTLLPVVGTALVLLFAHPGTAVQTVLRAAPLVGIGLISYSAYLWHQPLFVFARLRLGESPGPALTTVLIAATLVLAYVTWAWVEQPVRKAEYPWVRRRWQVFACSAAGIVAIVVAYQSLDNEDHYLANLTAAQRTYVPYLKYQSEMRTSDENTRCHLSTRADDVGFFTRETCLQLSADKPNVLLIGDSHAAHLKTALTKAFPEVNLMQATSSGCKPTLPYKGAKRCTDLLQYVLEDFLPGADVDAVIVSARWNASDAPGARDILGLLTKVVPNVVVMGPTMEYETLVPRILMKFADLDREAITQIAMQLRTVDRPEVNRMMAETARAAGVHFVDVQSVLCQDDQCRIFTPDGVPVSYDYGHFTREAALWAVRQLRASGALSPQDLGVAD